MLDEWVDSTKIYGMNSELMICHVMKHSDSTNQIHHK